MRTPSIGAVKKSKIAAKKWMVDLNPMDIYQMNNYAKKLMRAYTSAGWDKEDSKQAVIELLNRNL